MAVEASDFIPLGMENNCRDFMSTKPRLAAYQSIFPFNRSRRLKTAANGVGNNLRQPSLHGKRSRDSPDLYNPSAIFASAKNTEIASGDDILQSEIDRIVSHHTKKLREKDQEIQRLQERVKSLEQVLAHVADERPAVEPVEEDAESCCGSSDHGRGEQQQQQRRADVPAVRRERVQRAV